MIGGSEVADAFVADLGVPLLPPAVRHSDAVLVTGAWLAGCTSIVDALRDRLPGIDVVEADGLSPGDAPAAVIFVVSAASRLTESDCALLDAAAAHTDLVIGVVSKIDVHRTWREMLDAAQAGLAAHRQRYTDVSWIGVAAAPDLGEPVIDELVETVRGRLSSGQLKSRNRLRAWEFRLESSLRDYDTNAAAVGRRARASALRARRSELLGQRRLNRSEVAVVLRSKIQQARVELSHLARNRCAVLRAELSETAAEATRQTVAGYASYVRQRIGEVTDQVDDGITDHLADVAAELDLPPETPADRIGPPDVGAPPPASCGLETGLTLLLGAGFGLGVALTMNRLFAGLAPGFTVAATAICVAVGAALTLWMVSARRLLNERATVDRWAGDAVGALRATLDQAVATRVVDAERDWTTAFIELGEASDARVAEQVKAVDAELREHAMAAARAVAVRDREAPDVQRALAAVRAQLGHSADSEAANRQCS